MYDFNCFAVSTNSLTIREDNLHILEYGTSVQRYCEQLCVYLFVAVGFCYCSFVCLLLLMFLLRNVNQFAAVCNFPNWRAFV